MNWAHLPAAGGIYDQSARLIDEFLEIFNAQEQHRKTEEQDRERKASRDKLMGR